MSALFDHLAAILIGTTIILIVLVVQQRSRQHAVETTVGHTVQARTYSFARMLERDIENMRSEAEAMAVLGRYTCAVTTVGGQTTAFTFPTLLAPDQGALSPLGHVTYRLEATSDSVRAGGATRALFRVVRETDDGSGPTPDGGSGETIVGFDIGLFALRATTPATTCPDNLSRVRLDIETAAEGPSRLSNDQSATGTRTLSRLGFTFRPPHRNAGG